MLRGRRESTSPGFPDPFLDLRDHLRDGFSRGIDDRVALVQREGGVGPGAVVAVPPGHFVQNLGVGARRPALLELARAALAPVPPRRPSGRTCGGFRERPSSRCPAPRGRLPARARDAAARRPGAGARPKGRTRQRRRARSRAPGWPRRRPGRSRAPAGPAADGSRPIRPDSARATTSSGRAMGRRTPRLPRRQPDRAIHGARVDVRNSETFRQRPGDGGFAGARRTVDRHDERSGQLRALRAADGHERGWPGAFRGDGTLPHVSGRCCEALAKGLDFRAGQVCAALRPGAVRPGSVRSPFASASIRDVRSSRTSAGSAGFALRAASRRASCCPRRARRSSKCDRCGTGGSERRRERSPGGGARDPPPRDAGHLDPILLAAGRPGMRHRAARSPSSVKSRRPSVWTSSRPTGRTPRRRFSGSRSITVFLCDGSDTVVTKPLGLFSRR